MKKKLGNDASDSSQILEFLAVTGLPHDEESRRIVRSHAIRDANRRKRATSAAVPKKSQDGERPKPLPQAILTTKFRLDIKQKCKPGVPPGSSNKDRDLDGRMDALAEEIKALNQKRRGIPSLPGGGRLDPFDTLPVKMGTRQQALLQYQNTALKQNAFAFFSKGRFFSYVSADPAWLNATLALISLHYDLKLGQGVSRECLFHRGEALRIVNGRLRNYPQSIDDCTIGAIASLASFDTTNGSFSSATMHLRGLISILHNKGGSEKGLLALNGNNFLQKVVAWSDLCYSTSWDTGPQFPILESPVCSADLDDFIVWAIANGSPTCSLSSKHDLIGEMTEIFQALRVLSSIMSKPAVDHTLQQVFTRGVYLCEYKLLVVLDQADHRDDEFVLDRNSRIYGSTRLAAYLYLYMCLRELPRTAKICVTLATRLKSVLEGNGKTDILAVWIEDLFLLNWIAFMGALALWGSVEGDYFLGIVRRLKTSLMLENKSSFEEALKEVLWMNDPCLETASSAIWEELSQ